MKNNKYYTLTNFRYHRTLKYLEAFQEEPQETDLTTIATVSIHHKH